jgi:hypothetical protein
MAIVNLILLLLAIAGAVYGLARYIGKGRCQDCGRICSPLGVFCYQHNPDT